MDDEKYTVPDIPFGVMSLVAGLLGVDVSDLKPTMTDAVKIGSDKRIFFYYPLGMPVKALKMPKEVLDDLYRQLPELRKVTSPDWIYNTYLMQSLAEDAKAAVIMANASTWNSLNAGVRPPCA